MSGLSAAVLLIAVAAMAAAAWAAETAAQPSLRLHVDGMMKSRSGAT